MKKDERRGGVNEVEGNRLELLRLGALLAARLDGHVLLGLGGKELGVDVGENTTLRDDDVTEEAVELLVVTDGELEVTGDDAGLLVVAMGGEEG